MTWDPTWEKVFREGAWGRYPPEELIRFVARHYVLARYPSAQRSKIRKAHAAGLVFAQVPAEGALKFQREIDELG